MPPSEQIDRDDDGKKFETFGINLMRRQSLHEAFRCLCKSEARAEVYSQGSHHQSDNEGLPDFRSAVPSLEESRGKDE